MAGSLQARHPAFLEFAEDWEQLRDTYRGERIVKARGVKYLPPTSGMEIDGANLQASSANTKGWRAYIAYRRRAVFPEVVREAVESMLGVMHNKPPKIELPAALEPLREKATSRNESLEMLLRRINEEQLITGRSGLLLDLPKGKRLGALLPYIALYRAEHVTNWDDGGDAASDLENLNLVVLNESGPERTAIFDWEEVERYRVLVLGDPLENETAGARAVYRTGTFREGEEFSEEALIEPAIAGRKLERLPFVFANTKDIVAEPDDAPLIGLSNLSLTIYRGEADYRQALFMQGQDTLVTIGATKTDPDEETRVGAGAEIAVPIGGDAKFIGVASSGLPEMREALVNDYNRAKEKATALLEAVSRAAESGEALRVRVAARTASLNQIALAGAYALQEILRIAAEWVGANPEEVVVEPNLDFVADIMQGRELVDLMTAKKLGAPISVESIHKNMRSRGLTDLTFEEELDAMEEEVNEGVPGSEVVSPNDGTTNPDGPAADAQPNDSNQQGNGASGDAAQ